MVLKNILPKKLTLFSYFERGTKRKSSFVPRSTNYYFNLTRLKSAA
ncbi:hypothetical protein RU98_GL001913 [Enterococcus caccae]|nr:hypothetical protein RU98_GL001913 [Enterococcus caccae]